MNLALGLALLVAGGILIYMGWKGETLQHTLQDINKKRPRGKAVAANVAGKGGAFTTTKSTGESGGGGGGGAG